jgi:hypothetical protein
MFVWLDLKVVHQAFDTKDDSPTRTIKSFSFFFFFLSLTETAFSSAQLNFIDH